ncbi:MAG TPA: DUF262 domain-containing HNH endonuclease family protein [Flavobacteriales bacterium]|nr:DUF262 domain-containing HNH endonuclease family protein [Flavobacteriales bacterium]
MKSASKEKLLSYFQNNYQFEIPFFQRGYVWDEENWTLLLEHIEAEVEAHRNRQASEHFIGTIITKPLMQDGFGSQLLELIDGQQRLTTIAIVLKALADTSTGDFGQLRTTLNSYLVFNDTQNNKYLRIKHSKVDKPYFEEVMYAEKPEDVEVSENNINAAYHYFVAKFKDLTDADRDTYANIILHKLPVIAMFLGETDDEQEIFDTINSLGVRLTTAELLKNYLFREQELRPLYEGHWYELFEEEEEDMKFWGTTKSAGRVKRTNLELLLYSVLIIETGSDVRIDKLFAQYKAWLKGKTVADRKAFLKRLKGHAETYSNFPSQEELTELVFSDADRRLFHVIDFLEITTIYPLLLFIYERVSDEEDRTAMLGILESYLVRRLVCRLTNKNYNRLFIQLINELKGKRKVDSAALAKILLGYEEDTGRIPDDTEFKKAFGDTHLYNAYALEVLFLIALKKLNPRMSDRNTLSASGFSVEHMMPKKWREHWSRRGMTKDEELERDRKLKTLGNLTLVKQPLNSKMRNSSWAKKRKALKEHSLLNITTDYLDLDEWNEEAIEARAKDLAKEAVKVWPMI